MIFEKSKNNGNINVKKSEKEDIYLLNFVCEEKIGKVRVHPNIEKFMFNFEKFCVMIEEKSRHKSILRCRKCLTMHASVGVARDGSVLVLEEL